MDFWLGAYGYTSKRTLFVRYEIFVISYLRKQTLRRRLLSEDGKFIPCHLHFFSKSITQYEKTDTQLQKPLRKGKEKISRKYKSTNFIFLLMQM